MRRLIGGFALAATLSVGCTAPLAAQPPQSSGEPRQPAQAAPARQAAPAKANEKLTLPNKKESVRFAVIGDSGTGGSTQLQVAKQIVAYRSRFPFDFAIMLGDNLYGSEGPGDYKQKFEIPYKPLLDAGVKFYAALGNHDDPSQRMYKPFNMNGERYYTFKMGGLLKPGDPTVRFFALDSNYMDDAQLAFLKKELQASGSDWKIAFFHHAMYSSADRHGSDTALKDQLEPLFVKYSVDVVLTGHDHVYERTKPQKGIQYFVVGNSAKLRKGDLENIGLTAKGFDTGYGFMLAEIDGDQIHFQVISDQRKTIDAGTVLRSRRPNAPANAPPATVTVPKQPAQK
jgi:3',5'-cyclic AMP phosphodiesterase CpdA